MLIVNHFLRLGWRTLDKAAGKTVKSYNLNFAQQTEKHKEYDV